MSFKVKNPIILDLLTMPEITNPKPNIKPTKVANNVSTNYFLKIDKTRQITINTSLTINAI